MVSDEREIWQERLGTMKIIAISSLAYHAARPLDRPFCTMLWRAKICLSSRLMRRDFIAADSAARSAYQNDAPRRRYLCRR